MKLGWGTRLFFIALHQGLILILPAAHINFPTLESSGSLYRIASGLRPTNRKTLNSPAATALPRLTVILAKTNAG